MEKWFRLSVSTEAAISGLHRKAHFSAEKVFAQYNKGGDYGSKAKKVFVSFAFIGFLCGKDVNWSISKMPNG